MVVIACKIYGLEDNDQMLGRQVAFYVQDLMTFLWLG